MKTILSIIILSVCVSCASRKPLSESEMSKFSIKGDSILYENQYVAKFLNLEWEYYKGSKTMEISVEQVSLGADAMTDKIVDFIRMKHPNAKAEVKIPRKVW